MKKIMFFLVISLLLPFSSLAQDNAGKSACHIVYDAGSSGTRLYIYQQKAGQWIEHAGPKVSALADPVRGIRGKTANDIDAVTDEVVAALDAIQQDGPMKKGKAKWQGFDWATQCALASANVYATAGMRIAEQENAENSTTLWRTLKVKLENKVGTQTPVKTRTLTGFEEGLYAWLSVGSQRDNQRFGIVEMGGASSQVTFPCPECDAADSATRIIQAAGKPLQMYSYSFLGLGQDEAPKVLGLAPACAYGAGLNQENWRPELCAAHIQIMDADKVNILDPYNFDTDPGTQADIPTKQAAVDNWFLTGAFNYAKDSDIDDCCVNKGACFNPETACFRPIYFNQYLQALKVPQNARKTQASWTLGAVICQATECLSQAAEPPVCRWLDRDTGCLQ